LELFDVSALLPKRAAPPSSHGREPCATNCLREILSSTALPLPFRIQCHAKRGNITNLFMQFCGTMLQARAESRAPHVVQLSAPVQARLLPSAAPAPQELCAPDSAHQQESPLPRQGALQKYDNALGHRVSALSKFPNPLRCKCRKVTAASIHQPGSFTSLKCCAYLAFGYLSHPTATGPSSRTLLCDIHRSGPAQPHMSNLSGCIRHSTIERPSRINPAPSPVPLVRKPCSCTHALHQTSIPPVRRRWHRSQESRELETPLPGLS